MPPPQSHLGGRSWCNVKEGGVSGQGGNHTVNCSLVSSPRNVKQAVQTDQSNTPNQVTPLAEHVQPVSIAAHLISQF